MIVNNLRINGIENPVGFQCVTVNCSWKVTDTQDQKQEEAWIEVSTDPEFCNVIYEKRGKQLWSGGERLEMELHPRTTYYYRVGVKGDGGDQAVSKPGFFETGKMWESWEAKWILPGIRENIHPIVRKQFSVGKAVKRARVYGSGLGLFELYLNGHKLGNEYLLPCVSDYEKSIQAFTFSLDEYLKRDNTIEFLLGKGWYMGTFGLNGKSENYGNQMACIAEIILEYADGKTEKIITDGSWEYKGSDIEESGIYDGETQNHLLWAEQENNWKLVTVLNDTVKGTENLRIENLCDRVSLPVLVQEELKVQKVIHTPAGETVLDMGQNFAGWIRFHVKQPWGTRIELDYGEILQNGNFYNKNYRSAKAKFVYVSDGREEIAEPHFTYYGFRYVRVTGWQGSLDENDFRGIAVYSKMDRTGYVHTANEKINRLYENTVWGLKSNFLDIPTDCPQRDERLGWTGDAQIFSATACYHMDTRAFFHKFIWNLKEEQKVLGGAIPNYIPNIGHIEDVSSVWGDIAAILPDVLYKAYANKDEMEFAYPMIKSWVDYIDRQDAARGERKFLFDFGFTFGDWLALDGATPVSFKGGTDDTYISTVYYYHSCEILWHYGKLLGKEKESEHYHQLSEKIREAILREYYTPSGRLAIDTQTAYLIALKFHIYKDKEVLLKQFRERLHKDCYQIKCGFVGAPVLCQILAEYGMQELAYDFLLKEEFPSWLYCVNLGATTIWERWNSLDENGKISETGMNSLNHYAYGSVVEFLYLYSAGIRPLDDGFKTVRIQPVPDIRIPSLECSYDSVSGKYVICWKIEKDGIFTVHLEIPFNCTAYVLLPGDPEGERILNSGKYDFSYRSVVDYRKPYDENTRLGRLSQDSRAMEILYQEVPVIGNMASSNDIESSSYSLKELENMWYIPFDRNKFAQAVKKIMDIAI